jgi:hypothetical protein
MQRAPSYSPNWRRAHCDKESKAKTVRRRFCSSRCRAAAWQRPRVDRESQLERLVKVMAKEAVKGAEDFT